MTREPIPVSAEQATERGPDEGLCGCLYCGAVYHEENRSNPFFHDPSCPNFSDENLAAHRASLPQRIDLR